MTTGVGTCEYYPQVTRLRVTSHHIPSLTTTVLQPPPQTTAGHAENTTIGPLRPQRHDNTTAEG